MRLGLGYHGQNNLNKQLKNEPLTTDLAAVVYRLIERAKTDFRAPAVSWFEKGFIRAVSSPGSNPSPHSAKKSNVLAGALLPSQPEPSGLKHAIGKTPTSNNSVRADLLRPT